MLRNDADTIGPGGKNIIQAQYEMLGSLMIQKRARLDELQQQAWVAQLFPNVKGQAEPRPGDGQIDELERVRRAAPARLQASAGPSVISTPTHRSNTRPRSSTV